MVSKENESAESDLSHSLYNSKKKKNKENIHPCSISKSQVATSKTGDMSE